jgi:hypothetical protein
MTPLDLLLSLVGLFIVLVSVWWWRVHDDVGRSVAAGLDELRETVPPARMEAYHRIRTHMEERLALAEAKLSRVLGRIAFVAQLWVDQASSHVAEHRRALARWLFLFDAGAQTAISAIQRPGLAPWIYPLQGTAIALLYGAFGMVAVLLTALAFRRRPTRGWAVIDGIALVTGFSAVFAAVALLVARAVMDPVTLASVSRYGDMILSPLIVWGGFAAGLAHGVAHLQTEGDRLARDERRLKREVDARKDGITRLEMLAHELGVLVILMLVVCTPSGASAQAVPVRQIATASSLHRPAAAYHASGTEVTECGIILDGSASPDTAGLRQAIDSSLIVLRFQLEHTQCSRLLVAVASADTIWMARRSFTVPPVPMMLCTSAPASTGAWGSMLRGLSVVAADERRSDSTTRCTGHTDSTVRAYRAALASVTASVSNFLRSTHPLSSPDTTALVEMITYLGSGRFAAATLISDGVETKRPESIPEFTSNATMFALILSPTADRLGGSGRSIAAARALTSHMHGIDIVPFTAVSGYSGPIRTPGRLHP